MKARNDDPSKQYRGGTLTRPTWTNEAQDAFYNAAIVHGMGRWSKIADSIPNIDNLQVTNFGLAYEDKFPTEYEEIVNLHKIRVYNLYSEEHYNLCIETDTTYLFLSKKRKKKQFECGQYADVCKVLGCTCKAVKVYKTYRVCARHYTELQ